jgi:ABC-type branched-subunit amino acid transport system substrate-binding protein
MGMKKIINNFYPEVNSQYLQVNLYFPKSQVPRKQPLHFLWLFFGIWNLEFGTLGFFNTNIEMLRPEYSRRAVGNLRITLFVFVFICQLTTSDWRLTAQQPTPPIIKKSNKIEIIDGKKFYIHHVEKGQTLYSIAKTYGTTVDIVLSNNPDAIDGLKAGVQLKIPFIANIENIKKEIEKKETEKKEISVQKNDTVNNIPSQKGVKDLPSLSLDEGVTEDTKPIGPLHVAVFLPLGLNKVNEIDVEKISLGDEKIPDDIKTGIEFYEGMKMAFDSLRKGSPPEDGLAGRGFEGYMHVYDSNLDSAEFIRYFKKPEMKKMSLLIGPLHKKNFSVVLKFAKENKINIVCPALISNSILLENTYISKVTPSYITQTELVAKYVSEKFAGQNIILFNSAIAKEKPYMNAFKKTANPLLAKAKVDTVKEVTFSTLNNFISHSKPNIVVIPSTSQSFVAEAINKLFLCKQEQKDSITVFGLSSFLDMESLDFGHLNALHLHIPSYTYIDYNNHQTKNFILKYREEFKTEPTSYVFLGFDVGYFYLSGLQKYGNALYKKLPELHHTGIQYEFNFEQTDMNSGYENRGLKILKFENYSYTIVK